MKKIGLLIIPLMAVSFLANCKSKMTPWYLDKKYLSNLTKDDVLRDGGVTKEIEVNGLMHKVRLIDVDEDSTDATGTNKIHTTWEFVNLISDKNGYSLATYWNNTATSNGSSYDYLNSSIRKALTGDGNGDLHWFEKDSKTFSNKYKTNVLSMLPANFVNVLAKPYKVVSVCTDEKWSEVAFNDKLFLLTPTEMGHHYDGEEQTTSPYHYYYHAHQSERIKHQIKGSTGAITSPLEGEDLEGNFVGEKTSYAGFDSSMKDEYGGIFWLRSPLTFCTDLHYTDRAWHVGAGGEFAHYNVYNFAYGIAPAFCI